jgi:hypothetical protein
MSDKLVRHLQDMSVMDILVLTEKLYARAKLQAQTGINTNGEPVTQEFFATLNDVRRQLETARKLAVQ